MQLQTEWPMLGGVNKYHPKAGPWPAPPPRELWEEVDPFRCWYDWYVTYQAEGSNTTSWYDYGVRLSKAVANDVNAAADSPVADEKDEATRIRKRDLILGAFKGVVLPIRQEQNSNEEGEEPITADLVVSWYDSGVRLSAPHEKAPEAEKEEPATTDIVVSWYDSGVRLTALPTVDAAEDDKEEESVTAEKGMRKRDQLRHILTRSLQPKTLKREEEEEEEEEEEWPMLGGVNKYHPKAGPWPAPPPRELWEPLSEPESEEAAFVVSWYDSGVRLIVEDDGEGKSDPNKQVRMRKRDRLLQIVKRALQILGGFEPETVASWYDSGVRLSARKGEAAAETAATATGGTSDDARIALLKAEGEAAVARRVMIAELMAARLPAQVATRSAVSSWYDSGIRLDEPRETFKNAGAVTRAFLLGLFKSTKAAKQSVKAPEPAEALSPSTKVSKTPTTTMGRKAVKSAVARVAKAAGIQSAGVVFGPPPAGFEWSILFSDDVTVVSRAEEKVAAPAIAEMATPPLPATSEAVSKVAPSPPPVMKASAKRPVAIKADTQFGLPPAGFYWGGVY